MDRVARDTPDQVQARELVGQARRIIIITGAGISTTIGIPDFRTLNTSSRPKSDTRGLLSVTSLRNADIASYLRFMFDMYQHVIQRHPQIGATHAFLSVLNERGRLLRCYTQNIDGVECSAGLDPINQTLYNMELDQSTTGITGEISNRVVQLHGDLQTLKCNICHFRVAWDNEASRGFECGESVLCPECGRTAQERTQRGLRLRTKGQLLPDIVLYGEDEHPRYAAIERISDADVKLQPDLLLIMGTEARIIGVKRLITKIGAAVHLAGGKVIIINATPMTRSLQERLHVDIMITSTCEAWLTSLAPITPSKYVHLAHLPSQPASTRSRPSRPAETLQRQLDDVYRSVKCHQKLRSAFASMG